jgi:hypothetical protein
MTPGGAGSGDDAASRTRGQVEAQELIDAMRPQLDELTAFLRDEERAAKRKPPSAKRLARLRLVSEDVTSAVRLAKKSPKD